MDDHAVGPGTRAKVLLPQGDFEELQAGDRLATEPTEDGIENIVGEVERKFFYSLESLQKQDSAETVDDFCLGDDVGESPGATMEEVRGGVEPEDWDGEESRQKVERR